MVPIEMYSGSLFYVVNTISLVGKHPINQVIDSFPAELVNVCSSYSSVVSLNKLQMLGFVWKSHKEL